MKPTIGFALVTHREPEQALFLCQRLSIMFHDPPIALHHDFSQTALDQASFPRNVRFVKDWVRTGWGVIGVVDALLSAFRLLYESADADWGDPDWVVSLSAADYPIQTAETMLKFLEETTFDGFLDSRAIHDPGGPFLDQKLGEDPFNQPRYQQFAFRRYVAIPLLPLKLARSFKVPEEKYCLRSPVLTTRLTPFRDGFTCYAGDAWMTLRRRAAQVLLEKTPLWQRLHRHYSSRTLPEESFYQTLLENTPGLHLSPKNLRYTDWRMQYAHPRTLGREDFPRLLASSDHFARKFPLDQLLLADLDRAVAAAGPLDSRPPRHVPMVSVVIPSYNCARYLPKAIESVLAQTFTDLEIIVVDDGSTDETAAAVAPYLDRIQFIRQNNKGLPGARNTGIRASDAPFIALLDADDSWLPEKLALQMPSFNDPEVDIVYSDFSVEYADGASKASYLAERPLASEGFVFNNYIRSRFLFPSTMVLRRKAMEVHKLFNEEMLACEDIELFARMCLRARVALVNQPLMIRTEGAHNITANTDRLTRYTIKALHKILGTEKRIPPSGREIVMRELSLQYWYAGYTAFKAGRKAEARNAMLRTMRYDVRTIPRAAPLLVASLLPAGWLARLQARRTA